MLNNSIDQYWETINNLTWLNKLAVSDFIALLVIVLVPTAFFFGMMALISFIVCLVRFFFKLIYKKDIKRSESVTDTQDFLDYFIHRPQLSIPLGVLFMTTTLFFIPINTHQVEELTVDLETQKSEILAGVFEDYTNTYNGDVLKPKESVSPSAIHLNSVYKTSFMVDGNQYNDKTIYVMYSDKYDKDTLIPFEAPNVSGIIPTKAQRADYYTDHIFDDRKVGFRINSENLSNGRQEQTYLDGIDYIYNINVMEDNKD